MRWTRLESTLKPEEIHEPGTVEETASASVEKEIAAGTSLMTPMCTQIQTLMQLLAEIHAELSSRNHELTLITHNKLTATQEFG